MKAVLYVSKFAIQWKHEKLYSSKYYPCSGILESGAGNDLALSAK
jgi:hypothetical protein